MYRRMYSMDNKNQSKDSFSRNQVFLSSIKDNQPITLLRCVAFSKSSQSQGLITLITPTTTWEDVGAGVHTCLEF